jgi:hypothetical protein
MELMAVCHAGGAPVSTMKSMAMLSSGMKTSDENDSEISVLRNSCNGIGKNRRTRNINEIFYLQPLMSHDARDAARVSPP